MPVLATHRWLGMFVLPERRECQRLVCYCYTNPQYVEQPTGLEPVPSVWKTEVLPLHHGCILAEREGIAPSLRYRRPQLSRLAHYYSGNAPC